MDPLLPEDFFFSLLESGYAGILARARAVSQRHLDRLRALHRDLNSRHFAGRLRKIEIRLSGRMRRKLGHYEVREATRAPAIVISRRHLQRDGWTEVERTLLHEMVHQWQEESGHPVDHGVEFKTKSRELGARSRGTVNF